VGDQVLVRQYASTGAPLAAYTVGTVEAIDNGIACVRTARGLLFRRASALQRPPEPLMEVVEEALAQSGW